MWQNDDPSHDETDLMRGKIKREKESRDGSHRDDDRQTQWLYYYKKDRRFKESLESLRDQKGMLFVKIYGVVFFFKE